MYQWYLWNAMVSPCQQSVQVKQDIQFGLPGSTLPASVS